MNATRSLVPTPSALATSTGSARPLRQTEQSAERSEIRQHARRERPAREAADPADDLVARFDVDAGLFVVHLSLPLAWGRARAVGQRDHQNSSVWISASAVLRVGRSGRAPANTRVARSRRTAPPRSPPRACRRRRAAAARCRAGPVATRAASASTAYSAARPCRRPAPSATAPGSRGGHAERRISVAAASSRPAAASAPRAARRRAQQILKPDRLDRERQRVARRTSDATRS